MNKSRNKCLLLFMIVISNVVLCLAEKQFEETNKNGMNDVVENVKRTESIEMISELKDSLKSRVSPSLDSQNEHLPYTITEARLAEIRNEFMYWYFDQGGSDDEGDWQRNIHTSSPQIQKNLNFQLPFFGFRFNYTRVSMNGYLEFSDPPKQLHYPLIFPSKDWPKENDPSFIGPFYSRMRIGAVHENDVDQRRPGVYFRMERNLQTRTDQFGVELRERLTWDVREGIIGAEAFKPKHAVIVTWKNMSFAGGIDNALYVTNTFQLVLATDEVYTYAIFNYLNIDWTTHTEAGGDTSNGEGGIPAYVGFNAGNGTQSFEYNPYSQRSTIRDLTNRGWTNNFRGRHIFRIDEKILSGNCNKDISGANLPLVFAPESGNMLGGTLVNITGPCFNPTDKVTCRFGTEEVQGIVVDINKAICVQPRNVFAEGYIPFEIKIGAGKYNWKGKFFIETPATAAERIYFETSEVYEKSPKEIKITWEKYNLTRNENAPVQISLWGYRETRNTPELQYIDMLDESTINSGQYVISPENYKQRDNFQTMDMEFGFIQINLTESINYNGLEITPVIWSRPIPLSWYFGPQWESVYGAGWPMQLCDNWIIHDRNLNNFANKLPECPCSLKQAITDKGRYMPDYGCDKDSNPKCTYHRGAAHCVRSGPRREGSEQECCYDINGNLMLAYGQLWGSRPSRCHNLGNLPWNEANKVPTLSQWFHDVTPFYSCCLWQEIQSAGCEIFRFDRRPSQDCIGYQPPSVATIFEDLRIKNFDSSEYTFSGKGEFVLAHVNTTDLRLDVQGKFEQLPQNMYDGDMKTTQLTSVTAEGNSSAVIEVRIRPKNAQWRYRLDVFADGKRVYFDQPSLKFQHFPGVTVYTPTNILNQSEVIIMFESGAGVEVIETEGFIAARVYMPQKFINQTTGLFGKFNSDVTDDLTLPNGPHSGVITNDFGLKWLLTSNEEKKSDLSFEESWKMYDEVSEDYSLDDEE